MKIWLALTILTTASRLASACPACKEALAAQMQPGAPDGASATTSAMGMGYSLSIYFMLGLVLTLSGIAVMKIRKLILDEEARLLQSELQS